MRARATPRGRAAALAALACSYLAMEALWFAYSLPALYTPLFAAVQGAPAEYRPAYGLLAYPVLVWALWSLAVRPGGGRLATSRRATLLALAVYGVYNLTNLATLSRYSARVAAVDTAWGVAVFNAAAQAACTFL